MRGFHYLLGVLLVSLILSSGCRRERSRVLTGEQQQEDVMENPQNYRDMLDRARSKKSEAGIRTDLEQAVAQFRQKRSRLPTNLYELISSGVMNEIPELPPGQAISYDPVHGNVTLMPTPDGSGIALPVDVTNETPVRLQNVPLPAMP